MMSSDKEKLKSQVAEMERSATDAEGVNKQIERSKNNALASELEALDDRRANEHSEFAVQIAALQSQLEKATISHLAKTVSQEAVSGGLCKALQAESQQLKAQISEEEVRNSALAAASKAGVEGQRFGHNIRSLFTEHFGTEVEAQLRAKVRDLIQANHDMEAEFEAGFMDMAAEFDALLRQAESKRVDSKLSASANVLIRPNPIRTTSLVRTASEVEAEGDLWMQGTAAVFVEQQDGEVCFVQDVQQDVTELLKATQGDWLNSSAGLPDGVENASPVVGTPAMPSTPAMLKVLRRAQQGRTQEQVRYHPSKG